MYLTYGKETNELVAFFWVSIFRFFYKCIDENAEWYTYTSEVPNNNLKCLALYVMLQNFLCLELR